MLLPQLAQFVDLSLFLLRTMLALVFGSSGWSHVREPGKRGESLGMSPISTAVLGVVEIAGSVGLVLGIFPRVAATLLIGIMLGAIYKKIFVWRTGFWGDETQGWYYDLFYLVANLVILTTGGGAWTLL